MKPANDTGALALREALSLSVTIERPQSAMGVAWDEAADCLAKCDFAGFDASMRIFRKLNEGRTA